MSFLLEIFQERPDLTGIFAHDDVSYTASKGFALALEHVGGIVVAAKFYDILLDNLFLFPAAITAVPGQEAPNTATGKGSQRQYAEEKVNKTTISAMISNLAVFAARRAILLPHLYFVYICRYSYIAHVRWYPEDGVDIPDSAWYWTAHALIFFGCSTLAIASINAGTRFVSNLPSLLASQASKSSSSMKRYRKAAHAAFAAAREELHRDNNTTLSRTSDHPNGDEANYVDVGEVANMAPSTTPTLEDM